MGVGVSAKRKERHGASETLAKAALGHVSKNVLVRVYGQPTWEATLRDLFEALSQHGGGISDAVA